MTPCPMSYNDVVPHKDTDQLSNQRSGGGGGGGGGLRRWILSFS